MNAKLIIVDEIIPSQATADNCLKYSVATIQDLRALKKLNPNSVVRQADITQYKTVMLQLGFCRKQPYKSLRHICLQQKQHSDICKHLYILEPL